MKISLTALFLDIHPVPAVHVVWQDALLVVGDLVIEEETLGAELYGGHVVPADVEQVALLEVSELPVLLRTEEVGRGGAVVLGLGQAGGCEQQSDLCCPQHAEVD